MLSTQLITQPSQLEALRSDWMHLLERSTSNEPTLSPDWMLTWWQVFGGHDGRQLRSLLFFDGPKLVGLAPLLSRPRLYRHVLPVRQLELLASGEDPADEICSDFIGIIVQKGAERSVAMALASELVHGALEPWDELSLGPMNGEGLFPILLAQELGKQRIEAKVQLIDASPYIPLPSSWEQYLEMLSGQQRYLIRRSLRDFESYAQGQAQMHWVQTPEELSEGLSILETLHHSRWVASGGHGVFASQAFRSFHRELTEKLLRGQALELGWLSVGGEPVAAIYNHVWDNKVYFYQCGRRMDLAKKLRPGLVIHTYAIRKAIEEGRREYDFLGGLSRYKLDLSLANRPLVRLEATRPSVAQAGRAFAELALGQVKALRSSLTPPRKKPTVSGPSWD